MIEASHPHQEYLFGQRIALREFPCDQAARRSSEIRFRRQSHAANTEVTETRCRVRTFRKSTEYLLTPLEIARRPCPLLSSARIIPLRKPRPEVLLKLLLRRSG